MSLEKEQVDGLTISGDGSWRGFSSLFGFVSLIGWLSGKVIDICTKSKYCKQCEHWEKKSDTAEYNEWRVEHEPHCHANHSGQSVQEKWNQMQLLKCFRAPKLCIMSGMRTTWEMVIARHIKAL